METTSSLKEIGQKFESERLITEPTDLVSYEVDAALDRGTPDAVILPQSTEEVRDIIGWAHKHQIPVTARGAGTGLAGGAVAVAGGVILHFSRMKKLLELDVLGRRATVQPGMVNLELDKIVKKEKLYFPPDPASGRVSTIGGNIAVNAGGPHCFKYGVTTNYVTGLEVVTADGDVIRLGGKALDYPEVDFCGLITGSEGTLAIITQADLRLIRNPPGVKTIMASFATVALAGEAVSNLIAFGLVPATLEFMDQQMMVMIEEFAQAGLPVNAGAALIIEVDGYIEGLPGQVGEIRKTLLESFALEVKIAQSEKEREKIWYGRKSAAGAMARLARAYLTLDGTVPRSNLAEMLGRINQICSHLDLRVAYVFHAGDGNLHPFLLIDDPENQALMERIHQAGRQIMELCVNNNGTITGEHGVGLEKREYMSLMYNEDELQAMKDLKKVFDPEGILNPGKIFPDEGVLERQEPIKKESLKFNLAAVSSPGSNDEARSIILAAIQKKSPLQIFGGGTKSRQDNGFSYHISTENLSGIKKFSQNDLFVTAGSGMRLHQLQAELEKHGVWVPIAAPWEEATLGGTTAVNFNAPLRMRYGGLRDLVLGLEVILPDGRQIKTGRPVVKNVAGYDMTKLFIGSSGSLGLITEITFKLVSKPRAQKSLKIPLDSLEQSLEIGKQLTQVCMVASSLILCKNCCEISKAPYQLIYTAEGFPDDVTVELHQAQDIIKRCNLTGYEIEEDASGTEIWANWIRTKTQKSPDSLFSSDQEISQLPSVNLEIFHIGIPPGKLIPFIKMNIKEVDASEFVIDLPNGMCYLELSSLSESLLSEVSDHEGYVKKLSESQNIFQTSSFYGYKPESQKLIQKLIDIWDPARILNSL